MEGPCKLSLGHMGQRSKLYENFEKRLKAWTQKAISRQGAGGGLGIYHI